MSGSQYLDWTRLDDAKPQPELPGSPEQDAGERNLYDLLARDDIDEELRSVIERHQHLQQQMDELVGAGTGEPASDWDQQRFSLPHHTKQSRIRERRRNRLREIRGEKQRRLREKSVLLDKTRRALALEEHFQRQERARVALARRRREHAREELRLERARRRLESRALAQRKTALRDFHRLRRQAARADEEMRDHGRRQRQREFLTRRDDLRHHDWNRIQKHLDVRLQSRRSALEAERHERKTLDRRLERLREEALDRRRDARMQEKQDERRLARARERRAAMMMD